MIGPGIIKFGVLETGLRSNFSIFHDVRNFSMFVFHKQKIKNVFLIDLYKEWGYIEFSYRCIKFDDDVNISQIICPITVIHREDNAER